MNAVASSIHCGSESRAPQDRIGLAPSGLISFADQPRIVTRRLDLRRPEISDSVALARGLSEPLVARMLLPLPQPYHPGDALDWVLGWTGGESRGWAFALSLRKEGGSSGLSGNGEALGVVTLEACQGRLELGYWLVRSLWGQGLMSEAVSAVLADYFQRAPDGRISSGVIADNPASLRLQDRLGFAVTGVRDAWCQPRSAMVSVIQTELSPAGFTRV